MHNNWQWRLVVDDGSPNLVGVGMGVGMGVGVGLGRAIERWNRESKSSRKSRAMG